MMRVIGRFEDKDIVAVDLVSPGGAVATVMSWGAVVQRMGVRLRDGVMQDVLLGFEEFADYPRHSPYFGAVCGRVANRIRGAAFELDGKRIDLLANENTHCLHGGPKAMGTRPWTVLDVTPQSVTLGYVDRTGTNGFEGTVSVLCTYRLENEADLVCDLTATADAPTPVNLAQHNYYNLDGSADIGDHRLQVHADFHTPNDAEFVPTGEIRSVDGSPYDFRTPRPLRQMIAGDRMRYDGNLVLRAGGGSIAQAATVVSERNGMTLDVHTDQPGLQLYDAAKMAVPVPGIGGRKYEPFGGFCLEPQKFANAVNLSHFPDTILRPGQVYRQTSIFRFRAAP
jgi:aldose 1-epimerase